MTINNGVHEPAFRALFESAPGSYLVLTPELVIVAVSDEYLRATMTERHQILGRGLFEVFPDNPDDPAATGVANLRASLERVLKFGTRDAMAVQKYDIRRPLAEGGGFEERYWSPMNSPVFIEERLAYIIHRVEDVTEFVRLQQANNERAKITQELQSRAAQMEAEIYQRAQDLQESNRKLRELHSELESRVQMRTADLQRANTELQREIAERERAEHALRNSEEQLRQSQKLESIGRLAGGIAHDFNNLLSVILGYGELVLEELPEGTEPRHMLQECLHAGQRAASLTNQLLAFSRKQVIQPKVLELNSIVGDIHRMLRRVLGEDIDLHTVLNPKLGRVKADRGQVEQILINLAVNARDAMPDGGHLTIETANVELDEGYVATHPEAHAGPHVMLAVSDTGHGMDKATLEHIFEPFFTTKEIGRGTGLGLATVYGIVNQNGGSIWVYSEPGHGATFKVYLPQCNDSIAPPLTTASTEKVVRGDETILIIEDEPIIRSLEQSVLSQAGYQVLSAANGAEALRVAEAHTGPIDLLLTDVVMPGMNGRAAADAITATRPNIKILCCSGYTDSAIVLHGILKPGIAFLQKPFTPSSLRSAVRTVLDTVASTS